jgi:glucose-6-phosphate 1-dehydrogenase
VLQAPPETLPYAKGSWGPDAALRLPGERGWRVPEE